MQVSVRPEWERAAHAKAREWARAGVQAAVVDGASEVDGTRPRQWRWGGGRGSGERSAGL
eukprot:2325391-Prymnesium_polylepis.1